MPFLWSSINETTHSSLLRPFVGLYIRTGLWFQPDVGEFALWSTLRSCAISLCHCGRASREHWVCLQAMLALGEVS